MTKDYVAGLKETASMLALGAAFGLYLVWMVVGIVEASSRNNFAIFVVWLLFTLGIGAYFLAPEKGLKK